MGFLDRFLSTRTRDRPATTNEHSSTTTVVSAHLHQGGEDLEIVGEASYQDALWTICRGAEGDRIRHSVVAVLVPEPENPHDPNAIAVQIDGHLVGYFPRDTAATYCSGLLALMGRCGGHVALEGVIVGGGYYDDGPGRLGVWLEHDPRDFGLEATRSSRSPGPPGRPSAPGGTMRTGFTEAWLTDIEDDSYDLSWFNELPDGDRPAIALLLELLEHDPDPIDRHFQYAELEARLYRCRDLYESALDEFDTACRAHDAEMETICGAFRAKWGKVPVLETYRQMAIRLQKQKDWKACVWWAERGLDLYGNAAAREDAVEDLLKRRNRALAKVESAAKPVKGSSARVVAAALAEPSSDALPAAVTAERIEVLVCGECGASFERLRVRGRKPRLCDECRRHAN
jgi:hypothetical protein